MVLGDGIVLGWLGHPTFNLSDGTPVYPRRMPTFFETFPTLFLDSTGVVRADQPFRRAEAKYSLESVGLSVSLRGGALNGVRLDAPGTLLDSLELPNSGSCLGPRANPACKSHRMGGEAGRAIHRASKICRSGTLCRRIRPDLRPVHKRSHVGCIDAILGSSVALAETVSNGYSALDLTALRAGYLSQRGSHPRY